MDSKRNMVIIKGEIKTNEVISCFYNKESKKQDVKFNNGKIYSYAYENVEIIKNPKVLNPNIYKISQNKNFIDSVKECDCIIDITQGDNFSDIYGKKRFYTWTIEKRIVQKLRVPLILGPQTYGPFIDEKCKKFAAKVINVIGAKRISIKKNPNDMPEKRFPTSEDD